MTRLGRVLTHEDVLEVRRLAKSGEYSQCEIASLFGITQPIVSRILHARIWTELIESEGRTTTYPNRANGGANNGE
jgi:predicted transcriptional regulator